MNPSIASQLEFTAKMITLHICLTVRSADDIEKVSQLIAEHARLSRAEPGCIRFEVLQSKSDPAAIFIVEDWASQAELDVHREATAFTTIYGPQIVPLVDRRAEEVSKIE